MKSYKSIIRVLVVDDFEPWCDLVCSTLEKLPELRIVSRALDGLEAVHKAQELQPDLILLDMGLPTMNGIEAARRIREVSPLSKILFVSADHFWEIATEILRTGAGGYIVKSDAAKQLLPAVQAVLQGKPFLTLGLMDLGKIQTEDQRLHLARHERVTAPSKLHREVRLYTGDAALVDDFAHSIAAALKNGNVVVVAGTESDHAEILQKLGSDGVDTAAAIERKRFVLLDVTHEYSSSRFDASTDGNNFANLVPRTIGKALLTAKEEHLCATVA